MCGRVTGQKIKSVSARSGVPSPDNDLIMILSSDSQYKELPTEQKTVKIVKKKKRTGNYFSAQKIEPLGWKVTK